METFDIFSPAANWILFGLALIISEFFLPGVLAAFFGVAALVVGGVLAAGIVFPLAWQIALFGILAVLLLLILRRRVKSWFVGDVKGSGERDAIFAAGDTALVCADFIDSRGEVEFRGARWQARSSEALKAGERVTITGNEGLLLTVSANKPPTP